ncbi:hypothetical protein PAMA_016021 [Pampus argenteus]
MAELSEAAHTELLNLCEEQFAQLEKLQNEIILSQDQISVTIRRSSVFQDTKVKIQKMKVYQERLMESLADILEKHVPVPQNDFSAKHKKKKKNVSQELNEDLISVNEILELLMNKVLDTPHDPYVTIDSTFWPPYIEMLLCYGIAVRHQEDNFKIHLEAFC